MKQCSAKPELCHAWINHPCSSSNTVTSQKRKTLQVAHNYIKPFRTNSLHSDCGVWFITPANQSLCPWNQSEQYSDADHLISISCNLQFKGDQCVKSKLLTPTRFLTLSCALGITFFSIKVIKDVWGTTFVVRDIWFYNWGILYFFNNIEIVLLIVS